MSPILRLLLFGTLIMLGLSGCSDGQQSNRNGSTPSTIGSSTSDKHAANASAADPVIEITPAAQSQVLRIGQGASSGERLRVRLEVVAGGCSGMFHKLAIDQGPVQTHDVVQLCGEVDCVYAKAQLPFVQGTVIDWVKKEDKEGFTITSPNQTPENREKTKNWINQESEKRLKQIREEIDGRIAELRKAAARDPDNELAHVRLAQFLMDDGKYNEAVRSFDRVLALAPNNAKTHQLLGECLIALKEWDRAVIVLKKGKTIAESLGDKELSSAISDLLAKAESPPVEVKK
jgi:iron-sulfur cluster assembly accessory protein